MKLDSDFEECVKVSVCGKILTCFMQYSDIIVKEGDVWLADFLVKYLMILLLKKQILA